MKTYNLQLTEQELNIVYNALLQRPYGEVAALIVNIQKQITQTNEEKNEE